VATKSSIEWTEMTWNPVTGCTKVSQGCKNCYANRMALRLKAMGATRYLNGFQITPHEDLLDTPKKWKKPRTIFVNSMSDLFHEDIPDLFIRRVFATMRDCPQHTFQVLTKRSKRLRSLGSSIDWPSNVWMGVSVESAAVMSRIDDLAEVPAKIRFLSCEPLIGPLEGIPLSGIHWVIVGGESGPGARTMQPMWAESIRLQCDNAEVPFFFKQWGGVRKHKTGRTLNGQIFDEMPALASSPRFVQIAS